MRWFQFRSAMSHPSSRLRSKVDDSDMPGLRGRTLTRGRDRSNNQSCRGRSIVAAVRSCQHGRPFRPSVAYQLTDQDCSCGVRLFASTHLSCLRRTPSLLLPFPRRLAVLPTPILCFLSACGLRVSSPGKSYPPEAVPFPRGDPGMIFSSGCEPRLFYRPLDALALPNSNTVGGSRAPAASSVRATQGGDAGFQM
jgi:hypothetical protein